ncbi:hypothetical protein BS50DRAFT_664959 [Corynespora cassiicola Philippines]|uniref:Uncharacterized protein n=1 Tax=Corynespora cassiicola Philippines TaxID=1448308 RepID=A0A2T2NQI9_CORCC|nr:hypothetical protein BS50DRAFT_664959 [Corynespora cassiicola Philippines]
MKTWNYHDFGYSDDYCDFTSDDFSTPLKQLKLDYRFKDARRNRGTLLCYIIRHRNEQSDKRAIQDQTYEADGRTYPSTGGYFILAVDPKGAIYAISRMSPESVAKNYKREDLPKLRSSSDIMWGAWQGAGSGNKDIKYFFALYVVNQDTRGIILRALGNRKKTLALWPGIDFDMESDEGKALMGSPNGIGIGYLLIQRKPELGTKFISKVRVWKQEPFENFAHMLFYIEEWNTPEAGSAQAPRDLEHSSRGKEIQRRIIVR